MPSRPPEKEPSDLYHEVFESLLVNTNGNGPFNSVVAEILWFGKQEVEINLEHLMAISGLSEEERQELRSLYNANFSTEE